MKTIVSTIAVIVLLVHAIHAQSLKVDSVTVDSVWRTDSATAISDGQDPALSLDCIVSFYVSGTGFATCSLTVSLDSGTTWTKFLFGTCKIIPRYRYVPCGTRSTFEVRLNSGVKNNAIFRVKAYQYKPDISLTPATVLVGSPFAAPSTGKDTTLNVTGTLNNPARNMGYTQLAKVYLSTAGNGVWTDSTDSLIFPSWKSRAFLGTTGQQEYLIVKGRDKNGLWSDPESVLVQYGLKRPLAMVDIPAGTFIMGSADGPAGEKPAHQVTLTRAFSMMTTTMTREAYLLLTGQHPAAGPDTDIACPMRLISWNEAVRLCNALTKRYDGLDTCFSYQVGLDGTSPVGTRINLNVKGYRLPTEAEWEYACRAGTTTKYYWGGAMDTSYCWYYGNSPATVRPVGLKKPNLFGLYDMLGNIGNWVFDVFAEYDSSATPQTDPTGPAEDNVLRVQRGGNVFDVLSHGEDGVTSAFRENGNAPLQYFYNGIRLVKTK